MNQQIIMPTELPPMLLERIIEVRRFLEAMKRKELHAAFGEHFDNARTRMLVADGMELLRNERVVLGNELT